MFSRRRTVAVIERKDKQKDLLQTKDGVITMKHQLSPEVTFRYACEDDYEIINELCDKRFGTDYLTKEEFEHWLNFPGYFRVAFFNNTFAGYAFLEPEDIAGLAAFIKIDISEIESYARGRPVIHCRSAAMVPKYEHSGIMYELLHSEIEYAKNQGFGAAFAPAWKYNNKVPMASLMKQLGFEYMCERHMLWHDLPDYKCIVCNGPCTCDAVIYRKKLDCEVKR